MKLENSDWGAQKIHGELQFPNARSPGICAACGPESGSLISAGRHF
jgi:hypothetical protein